VTGGAAGPRCGGPQVRELEVARSAALAAGALLRGHFAAGVRHEWKGRGDLVTVADRESEGLVREHLAAAFPDDLVVGEEGPPLAEEAVAGRRRWYVDPLDGTTNFVKGQPRWAVSVAFCDANDVMAAAAVHMPLTGETLTAAHGQGATRDGEPLHAPDVEPHEALALLGPLDGLAAEAVPLIARAVLSLRVTGSTVCDLADLAAGRGDLYLGVNQGRWDLAAGALIAAEAGISVTGLRGEPLTGPGDAVFAAGRRVHAALLPGLRAAAEQMAR